MAGFRDVRPTREIRAREAERAAGAAELTGALGQAGMTPVGDGMFVGGGGTQDDTTIEEAAARKQAAGYRGAQLPEGVVDRLVPKQPIYNAGGTRAITTQIINESRAGRAMDQLAEEYNRIPGHDVRDVNPFGRVRRQGMP